MCRLVAYAGTPLPLRALFFGGDHALHRQAWAPKELRTGSVNVDGYGLAWPGTGPGEGLVRLARQEPAWHDPDLPDLLGSIEASRALAVLRNATPGLPVDRSGLPPLVHGAWGLALNGFVPAFRERHMRALREPLHDRWYGHLAGSTDTETLFLRVLQELDGGAGPGDALRAVRDAVAERMAPSDTAPLTLVLLGPEGVTALHSTINGPVNSLYLCRGGAPAPGGVLLASEPLTRGEPWEMVPAESLVQLGMEGARVEAL